MSDLTINQLIEKAGIKQCKGAANYRGYKRTVMEYNGICVLRPYIAMYDDVNEVTTNVLGVSI